MGSRSIALAALTGAVLVICRLAVPAHVFAPVSTREISAIRTIRSICILQVEFLSRYGRYAQSLAELANFTGSDISATGSGYGFTMNGSQRGYVVKATPMDGHSHEKTFCSDERLVIETDCGPGFPNNRNVDPPPPKPERDYPEAPILAASGSIARGKSSSPEYSRFRSAGGQLRRVRSEGSPIANALRLLFE